MISSTVANQQSPATSTAWQSEKKKGFTQLQKQQEW